MAAGKNAKNAVLAGGLDLVTPPVAMPAGKVLNSVNYEATAAGYQRIQGFERYMGFEDRGTPSHYGYRVLNFHNGSIAPSIGNVIKGNTSSGNGTLLVAPVLTSGSWAGGDAAGYLVVDLAPGASPYTAGGETLSVAFVNFADTTGPEVTYGAANDTDNATWARAAIERYRALITVVPGTGAIRGLFASPIGNLMAVRDSGTKAIIFLSNGNGWPNIAEPAFSAQQNVIAFTAGSQAPTAGQHLVGAASAASSAFVSSVILTGTYGGGDAAGFYVCSGRTGAYTPGENLKIGATVVAVLTTDTDALANLVQGGRYEAVNYNFFGGTSTTAVFGVDGANKAFMIDANSAYFPIPTGTSPDKPQHIAAHKKHLFLSFAGGGLLGSQTGQPFGWNGTLGATTFGLGQEITGIVGEILDTLFVFCRSSTQTLSGSSSTDFEMKPLSAEAGGLPYSMQNMGTLTYADQQGVRSTTATQQFGSFSTGTLTEMIRPLLEAKKAAGVTVTASLRVRSKTQYRLFFSDGTGISIYLGKTKSSFGSSYPVPEIMPFDLGKVVRCCCSIEGSDGIERLYFGSDDGYVYRLDSGTSFDGQPITSYMRLAFDACGSPSQQKRFMKVTLQVDKPTSLADTSATASLLLSADFSYGDPDRPPVVEQSFSILSGTGGFWNENNWNQFSWSSAVFGRAEAWVSGLGRDISIAVRCTATYEQPHTIRGYEIQFSPRGLTR